MRVSPTATWQSVSSTLNVKLSPCTGTRIGSEWVIRAKSTCVGLDELYGTPASPHERWTFGSAGRSASGLRGQPMTGSGSWRALPPPPPPAAGDAAHTAPQRTPATCRNGQDGRGILDGVSSGPAAAAQSMPMDVASMLLGSSVQLSHDAPEKPDCANRTVSVLTFGRLQRQ